MVAYRKIMTDVMKSNGVVDVVPSADCMTTVIRLLHCGHVSKFALLYLLIVNKLLFFTFNLILP